MALKTRSWVATINNWDQDDVAALDALPCSYLVYGREIGKEGTPHLQIFFELANARTFTGLKRSLPRAHLEPKSTFSTPEQASIYCKKDGDFVERGEISAPGKRSDLERLAIMVQEGKSRREICAAEPVAYMKFAKHICELKAALIPERNWVPEVICYYGPTGSGKSFSARQEFRDEKYYKWGPGNLKWFNNYWGEQNVLIEEYRGQFPFGFLLDLLDEYQMQVEVKGGFMEFAGRKIIITSPVHPREWYPNLAEVEGNLDQLLGRFDKIVRFEPPVGGVDYRRAKKRRIENVCTT